MTPIPQHALRRRTDQGYVVLQCQGGVNLARVIDCAVGAVIARYEQRRSTLNDHNSLHHLKVSIVAEESPKHQIANSEDRNALSGNLDF